MREITGHVFIAECREAEFMFGKPTSENCVIYENIESNGLVPYDSQEQARDAAEHFFMDPYYLVSLAKLWMKIAETRDELDYFKDKTNLIVIMKEYDRSSKIDHLFGPLPTKKGRTSASPLPGAYLSENGFMPHRRSPGIGQTPFERAKRQLTEVNRQGGCPAVIAQFRLKKLEEVFRR
jgi:hypothetical protein